MPYLQEDYIGSISLIVGAEDYTGKQMLTTELKLSFPLNEFMELLAAEPGEARRLGLDPQAASNLGHKDEPEKRVIVEKENMLKRLESYIRSNEMDWC